jgi:hypothetical protein
MQKKKCHKSLKKREDYYHPKDSTRRDKKDGRSGENPVEGK